MTTSRTIREWTLHEEIGRGGMGVVYRATHRYADGRSFAVKVLRPDLSDDPEARARILREARVLWVARHPNLVAGESPFDEGDEVFLPMELLQGQSLAAWLGGHPGPRPASEALPLVRQAALGVGHAHHLVPPIIHRDLKPSNLFVLPDGTVKVLDFGLARVAGASSLGTRSQGVGTPLWMAPEVLEGRLATPSSDVYALGLILYRLLAGRLPFEADEATPTMVALRALDRAHQGGLEPLATHRPDLAPALAGLVMQAVATDPAERPPDAVHLAARLDDVMRLLPEPDSGTPPCPGRPDVVAAAPREPDDTSKLGLRLDHRGALVRAAIEDPKPAKALVEAGRSDATEVREVSLERPGASSSPRPRWVRRAALLVVGAVALAVIVSAAWALSPGGRRPTLSQLEDARACVQARKARSTESWRAYLERQPAGHCAAQATAWIEAERQRQRDAEEAEEAEEARQAEEAEAARRARQAEEAVEEAEAVRREEARMRQAGFVRVEPGSFWMGSPDGKACPEGYPAECLQEPGRAVYEVLHRVTLTRAFWLQATEVTQGAWQMLMGNSPSYFKNCGADCPVEQVSWYDAVAYANARSRAEGLEECYDVTGRKGIAGSGCKKSEFGCKGNFSYNKVGFRGLDCTGYRLPTEAEWEYAARAGTTTALYTGGLTLKGAHHGPELAPIAWYGGNSGVTYKGGHGCTGWREKQLPSSRCGTHPVGEKGANALGLHDVLGSVREWCHDAYVVYGGDAQDPVVDAGSARVVRGGSWYSAARYVRAAHRGGSGPARRLPYDGFRLARSIPGRVGHVALDPRP